MLIIELVVFIGLTIWAWNRGWKGWSLLPMGIGLPLAFILGYVMGSIGISDLSTYNIVGIIIDLLILGILIFMVAKGRKKEKPVVFVAPAVPLAPSAVVEIYNQPARALPATIIEPATVLTQVNKARLVLPDNRELAINESVKTIGRNDFEKIVPPENLKYISRRHFMIKSDGSRYYIEDQNSSNSTKVNGINIKGMGKQELRDGDRIDLADTIVLTFKVSSTV